ncbi:MAG: hypothetical protein M3340_00355 [Actinomycetota bacterium]|nr:hypothetical protein [Actinomycetota bacterium]
MTRYAGIVIAAFAICVAVGLPEAAAYGAAVVLVAALILDGGYRFALRRASRPAPEHRTRLDRLVRTQWGLSAGAGAVLGALGLIVGLGLLDPPLIVRVVIVAGTVAIVTIFTSSLVDWYWILPRMGGIVRRAPCEEAGGQKWARVTGVWQFHRAVATLVVSGCVTGVAAYMGQVSEDDAKTAWFVVAAVFAAATLAFNSASLRLLFSALNPRQHVGDLVDIHGRPVYIVDIAIQGAKYKRLDNRAPAADPGPDPPDDPPPDRPFGDKSDGSLSLDDLGRYPTANDHVPPCATRCTAINVYCRHNEAAYE